MNLLDEIGEREQLLFPAGAHGVASGTQGVIFIKPFVIHTGSTLLKILLLLILAKSDDVVLSPPVVGF